MIIYECEIYKIDPIYEKLSYNDYHVLSPCVING